MTKKPKSFPAQMRDAQQAFETLAAECEKYSGFETSTILIEYNAKKGDFSVLLVDSDDATFETFGNTAEDAATALLHAITGTEEARF